MIKPITRGIMRKTTGNNPIGTHEQVECRSGHITLKRRDDNNYRCQECLRIKFESEFTKPKNQKFLSLKKMTELI